ncbi:hypothetical protein ACLESO_28560 [Pyxidicoccus sp. 3LG]
MKATRMIAGVLGAGLWLMGCGGPVEDSPGAEAAPEAELGEVESGLTASISCSHGWVDVTCTATPSGGVPPYSYAWTEQRHVIELNRTFTSGIGSGPTVSTDCPGPDGTGTVLYTVRARVKVTDATGAAVTTGYSDTFFCS